VQRLLIVMKGSTLPAQLFVGMSAARIGYRQGRGEFDGACVVGDGMQVII
jgi:hypothetical protein